MLRRPAALDTAIAATSSPHSPAETGSVLPEAPSAMATSSPHSPAEAESAVCRIGEEPRQCADVLGAEIADSVHRILFGQNPTANVCGETSGFSFLNFEVAVAG